MTEPLAVSWVWLTFHRPDARIRDRAGRRPESVRAVSQVWLASSEPSVSSVGGRVEALRKMAADDADDADGPDGGKRSFETDTTACVLSARERCRPIGAVRGFRSCGRYRPVVPVGHGEHQSPFPAVREQLPISAVMCGQSQGGSSSPAGPQPGCTHP